MPKAHGLFHKFVRLVDEVDEFITLVWCQNAKRTSTNLIREHFGSSPNVVETGWYRKILAPRCATLAVPISQFTSRAVLRLGQFQERSSCEHRNRPTGELA